LVALNTAGEAAKDAVDALARRNEPTNLVIPMVLRPWPEEQMVEALGDARSIVVAERASQYGANNYLANEIGAALQRRRNHAAIVQRTYGIGGLNFTNDDALAMYADCGLEDAESIRSHNVDRPHFNFAPNKTYHGAWAGDENYHPLPTLRPLSAQECTINAGLNGRSTSRSYRRCRRALRNTAPAPVAASSPASTCSSVELMATSACSSTPVAAWS
jgi:pyruvate ferredoxin oxidoreductase alpha subunit